MINPASASSLPKTNRFPGRACRGFSKLIGIQAAHFIDQIAMHEQRVFDWFRHSEPAIKFKILHPLFAYGSRLVVIEPIGA